MADYKIESEVEKILANGLSSGGSATTADGSTFLKSADGSLVVIKNGQVMNGVVGSTQTAQPVSYSAPAAKKTATVVKPGVQKASTNTNRLVSDSGTGNATAAKTAAQTAVRQSGTGSLISSVANLGTAGTQKAQESLFDTAVANKKEQYAQTVKDIGAYQTAQQEATDAEAEHGIRQIGFDKYVEHILDKKQKEVSNLAIQANAANDPNSAEQSAWQSAKGELDYLKNYRSELELQQRRNELQSRGGNIESGFNELLNLKSANDITGYENQKDYLRSTYNLSAADLARYEQYYEVNRNQQIAEQNNARLASVAKDRQGLASLASVGSNLLGSFGIVDVALQNVRNALTGNNVVDYNTQAQRLNQYTNTLRGTVSDTIKSDVGKFAYNTGMSMADSLMSIGLTLAGVPHASALLGGAAATSAVREAKERGATDAQALGFGLLSGAAEAAFEELSIDKLVNMESPKSVFDAVKKALIQGGIEASEEVNTTLANTISDAIIMGDKAEYQRTKQQYINNGASEKDAQKLAAVDWLKGLGMDALGGFASGALMGIGGNIVNAIGNRQTKADVNATPVDTAILATIQGQQVQERAQTQEAPTAVDQAMLDTFSGRETQAAPQQTVQQEVPQQSSITEPLNTNSQTVAEQAADYQSPIYDNSVGAARIKQGPYVESQNKTLKQNRYSTAEEKKSVPIYVHEQVSNALQMERAQGQLLADTSGNIVYFDEQVQDLLAKEQWDNSDRDVAMLLREEAWRKNDMDKWRDLSDKITDTNSEAAKTLQGTQKWIDQPHPAQAVVRAAEKALDTASDKVDTAALDQFIIETGKHIEEIDAEAERNSLPGASPETTDGAANTSTPDSGTDTYTPDGETPKPVPNRKQIDDYGAVLLEIAQKRKMLNAKHFVNIAIKQGENDINWLRSMVYNGLYNVAADYAKPTNVTEGVNKGLRRMKSFVITNQLFRVTTNVANVVSNIASNLTESAANVQAFANLADLAMSASTGTRSHGFENVFGKTARQTAKNFAQKSIAEIWLDTSTESTDSKYQQGRDRSIREYKMTGNKLFSVFDAVLSTALNTTDAFSTGLSQGAVEQSLQRNIERAKVTAENAADIAEQRGLDTTFHNKTILGTALTKMSKAANANLEYGLGNAVIGNYLNVPAAIIAREASKMPTIGTIGAIANMAVVITDSQINKHSGVSASSNEGKYGQFGSLLNKMSGDDLTIAQRQARAAQQFGRALGGGALEISAFVAMAMRGWVKRFDDEDKDKAAYDTAMGNQGLMINWSAILRDMKGESTEWQAGDIRWSLGRLEPLVINMNLGLDVAEILQNDETLNAKDAMKLSIDALESGIADLSMIQNIQAIIDGLKYKEEDENAIESIGKTLVSNNVTSLTPGLIQQAAKASDPYYRDLYTGETFGQQLVDSWKSTIPGLRQTLPVKLTGEGAPKEYAGTRKEQIVNSLLNPYTQTTQKENLRQDFYEKYDALPAKNAVSKVTVNGEEIALNSAQKRVYQETFGSSYTSIVDALQGNESFNNLPEDVQKYVVSNAKSLATAWGKEATGVGYVSDDWDGYTADDMDGAIDKLISKAITTANGKTGYLPKEESTERTKVDRVINSAMYAGTSQDILEKASAKANNYYLAIANSKYGGELSDTQKELSEMSKEELAEYFIKQALEEKFEDTDKSGSKWNEYEAAYKSGEIADAVIFAMLPDKAVDAYDKWGREANVTAQQWVDALSFKNSAEAKEERDDDDTVTVSAEEKFDAWLDKQKYSTEQAQALRRGFYTDSSANYTYAAESVRNGTMTAEEAKKELSSSLQKAWSVNVKDSGLAIPDYIDFAVFAENAHDTKNEAGKTTEKRQDKIIAYISGLDISDQQKGALYACEYSSSSAWKKVPTSWKQ